jgi:hypothetical protein
MCLDLTPRDYLEMLTEEYREYQDHWHAHRRVSIRKAINCCALSNALPEIIIAHYSGTEKVHNKTKTTDYRRYLRTQCEAHHTVRDICDLSKHAKLTFRYGPDEPTVRNVKPIKQTKGSPVGLLLALTHAHDAERRVVRRKESAGSPQLIDMDEVLEQVITSWKAIFEQDKL